MVFSSTLFLFLFLPFVLITYFIVPQKFKNYCLLGSSLLCYGWSEPDFLIGLIISILCNYIFGILLAYYDKWNHIRKLVVGIAVVFNIGILIIFKYTNFIVDNLNIIISFIGNQSLVVEQIKLPIGISFFTFQALSYVIDVYRRQNHVQKKFSSLALYVAFFPKLVMGPIVRYKHIAQQIESNRKITVRTFGYGVRRFIFGIGKKVLIANPLSVVADQIFGLPYDQLSTGAAWLGIICYTLQIYFDFSGYSDMAIGLGKMFGFRFMENFNYPYIARSIKDFWRRWHISLSSWFRDYLYIPMGGNRNGPLRTYLNLLAVFLLCGLWHGSSWNFLIWGLYHGLFLVFEKVGLGTILKKIGRPFQHMYTIFIVMIGWVFFRTTDMYHAIVYLRSMFGGALPGSNDFPISLYLNGEIVATCILGIICSAPILYGLTILARHQIRNSYLPMRRIWKGAFVASYITVEFFILLASSAALASGTHNPFIYFKF